MPRRRVLTDAQVESLLALPTDEPLLVRHWTLDGAEIASAERRRGGHNQLGFALQLCAFRYPGRLLRPGDIIPEPALRFVAGQLRVDADALASYAIRPQTRREQLDALREDFGFSMFAPGHGRELLAWLLPIALATTSATAVAAALMDELRRRRIIAPGPSVVERLVAAALLMAERHVAGQLTRSLSAPQTEALDALLQPKDGTSMSVLAWARQPPGAPGHRALARIVEQLACLRTVGLDRCGRCGAEAVHPERLRKLAREGGRFTAQHLRALSPLRRRATLVATVLDTTTRLTDDGVALFDRAVGRMFRRAEAREEEAVLRDARAVNDKVRLLAKLGAALIQAKQEGTDLDGAVAASVGWDRLAASVAEARQLARPDKADLPALATRAWPVLHRLGPLFLGAFQLRAVPAAASTLRAIELLGSAYDSGGRKLPSSLPISFLRPAWRHAVHHAAAADGNERRTWEAATLLALRDRLRSGDIWIEGSRQWRAVEDQLIPPTLFAAMREAGPLPVAVPATAEEYLADRRALLNRRLTETAAKAAADTLEDVTIRGDELKVSPLKAITPNEAEALADRFYRALPCARITGVLAEVDRWTGFSSAFTHLHTGLPTDDSRVVLTAVLADATNLGLTRMADACSVASYRQLAWTAGWHLREDTYRNALAMLVNAQHSQPLAAVFGAADVSSSDGQGFPTSGRGEAVGATNAHYGRDVTAMFYTHVSGRHAPYNTVAIPPSGEAAYVIDGLLYHEADMTIATHHTDGGGVSDHVFGLAHLLGFRFAPRIPNLAERRLYAFEPATRWRALAPFIAGRPDDKLLAAHWDDVLRLTASVRTGVVSASLMLKRLGSYPRQNGLALALREIGRIERTLYTLDWLEQPQLRRQATAELNKGESRNALARAVCFHRLGRLRDRTVEAQQHRASGLALVTAAIALWNTVYLGRALEAVRRRGETVPDALLAHIAPLGWQHINLTGDYLWEADSLPAADEFRQLRQLPVAPPESAAA